MADFSVQTKRGRYLVRDHTERGMGFAVVPPYSPGPPDFWADCATEAEAWCLRDSERR